MQKFKTFFKNRVDASNKLKDIIPMQKLKDEDWALIAISNGGLVLAKEIAKNLPNKIDFLFNESIKAPNNPECEIARVSENEEIVIIDELVDSFDIKLDYIYGEAQRKHEEKILSYIYKYRKGRAFLDVKDRVVLLIDEGSETGMILTTAIKSIFSLKPKAIYVALPIIPTTVLDAIEPYVDDVFFIHNIDDYVNTSLYYENLDKVDEDTIEKLLGD